MAALDNMLFFEGSLQLLDDVVDQYCYAWNKLIDQPWKIMSTPRRDWAIVGQSF